MLAILGPDEAAALQHDLSLTPERASQLVAVCPPSESPSEPLSLTPAAPGSEAASARLADLVAQTRANLIVLGRSAVAEQGGYRCITCFTGSALRPSWCGRCIPPTPRSTSCNGDVSPLEIPARVDCAGL